MLVVYEQPLNWSHTRECDAKSIFFFVILPSGRKAVAAVYVYTYDAVRSKQKTPTSSHHPSGSYTRLFEFRFHQTSIHCARKLGLQNRFFIQPPKNQHWPASSRKKNSSKSIAVHQLWGFCLVTTKETQSKASWPTARPCFSSPKSADLGADTSES